MAGSIQIRGEGQSFVVASFNGSSSAVSLDLGFIPLSARIMQITDGDTAIYWMYGMDSGMCMSHTSTIASVTSNGITTMDGSAGNGIGLTIGTSAMDSGKTHLAVFER